VTSDQSILNKFIKQKMKKIILTLIVAANVLFMQAQKNPEYKFLKKISLAGDGKWDYLKMDGEKEKLYVSHGDRVHVIDLTNDKVVTEWTGLNSVHGISLGKEENKAYIANTGENNVVIYNTLTWENITTVELKGGIKPDCILYDKFSKQAFVFCGKSNNVYVIDGKTDKVVATIEVGGKPEFACTDDAGFVYNNIEDKNEVVVIDVKTCKVVKRYSLENDKAPTGIAIDIKSDRLFVACEETKNMVVLSKSTGKRIATVPIGGKVDGVVYEKELHLVITSNGEGTATIIKQENADSYKEIQTVKTHPGLKTIVHRGTTHNFFLTGADLQADGKTIVPNTFGVYVYSMQ
jgi:YVTN family beta-propeller protein